MKKDKEWLREKIKEIIINCKSFSHKEDWDYGYLMALHDCEYLISQLEEPKKPIIPQFVASYIELNKGWNEERQEYTEDDSNGMWLALDDNSMPNSVSDWLFNEEKVETFAKAWIYGYEVEKEPYYYVAFEGDFNLLYVTNVDIYGENGKFNYSSEFDKSNALKFTDKSRAKYLADFLGAIVLEEKK